MGTNLTAPLDNGPQTGVSVSLEAVSLETASFEVLADTREVLRCLHCQLVQYRTQNSLCRRCHTSLDTLPEPDPVAARALESESEPGVETAEASGMLVPDVAGAIRAWRQGRGLSQRELAERMRVPRTYVSKIENDKATPTISSLQRMATAMDTTVASLIECTGGPPPNPTAELLQDPFLRALLPYLPNLNPQHRSRILDASRRLLHR